MNLLTILKIINRHSNRTIEDKLKLLNYYLYCLQAFLVKNNLDKDLIKELIKFNGSAPSNSSGEEQLIETKFNTSDFFKDSLLSVYSKFGTIKGKLYPLITGDLDKLFEDYAKKIGYSIDTHKEVLEIIQWAKEKELLNIGIEKFILSYYWDSLKELKEKDNISSNMVAQDF